VAAQELVRKAWALAAAVRTSMPGYASIVYGIYWASRIIRWGTFPRRWCTYSLGDFSKALVYTSALEKSPSE
jgi:hypothetical protein